MFFQYNALLECIPDTVQQRPVLETILMAVLMVLNALHYTPLVIQYKTAQTACYYERLFWCAEIVRKMFKLFEIVEIFKTL